ncbi:MAG: dienelactone hydrolase family protein [Planctomycetia bacterium]|nr:dienelactone hydrolase family protein [Planctomycetia bacterium]
MRQLLSGHYWGILAIAVGLFLPASICAAAEPAAPTTKIPQSVAELWAGYDPRAEPLNVEVLREWVNKGIGYRYLRYTVGTFRGQPARVAAVYAVPQGARKVPGLVQIHGGGQSANLNAVRANAERGYACISINWLGNRIDGIRPGLPNTDWGAVDATQRGHNSGFTSLEPDAKTIDSVTSPKNSNWYSVTSPKNSNWYLGIMAARRALTFLEQQPEVDGQKLGVYGHSMGGTVTAHVAAVDPRVRAAAPTCGGFGSPRAIHLDPLSQRTIADEAHLPLITCPLLLGSPTNDFNGAMDEADRAIDVVHSKSIRTTRPVHHDHRTTPAEAVCIPLWFDEQLKGTFHFPQTPRIAWKLPQPDGVPLLEVTPDKSRKIVAVELFYSRGDDPRRRFWIAAAAHESNGTWTAQCPVLDMDSTLRAFANVTYAIDAPVTTAEYYYEFFTSDTFSISSRMLTATPAELRAAGVKGTDAKSLLIDDFARDWQDWWIPWRGSVERWTRKIGDPKWRGPDQAVLEVTLKSAQDNTLVVVLKSNPWWNPTHVRQPQEYFATIKLKGSPDGQTVRIPLSDLHSINDSRPPNNWTAFDELGLVPSFHYERGGKAQIAGQTWRGPPPVYKSIGWSLLAGNKTP